MRALIQRVSSAKVVVEEKSVGEITLGLLVLLGIEEFDNREDAEWLASKISQLRIFTDDEGKMNRDIKEGNGDVLVVSQFTLHASTKKGNRPSFIRAARPEQAIPLYNFFILQMEVALGKKIQTGEFGAMMDVHLVNAGPVTIWMDSKAKE
ncbi:MAG: D-aminoacyl-tRNA deacylase [Flavobacteriales bacterium]|nr:D-aminoacyl-tRNA deacylase [Flavobacteriales bacterium]